MLVHSFIFNSQELKPKYSKINEWLNKLFHIHTIVLVSINKERSIDTWNKLDGTNGHYTQWKQANPKRSYTIWFHLYNIFRITKLLVWRTNYWFLEVRDGGEERYRTDYKTVEQGRSYWWQNSSVFWCGIIQIYRCNKMTRNYMHTLNQFQLPGFDTVT